jgi:hypothetical protein
MQDETGDPLLHELVEAIKGFDRERVNVMVDMFTTTIHSAETAGALRDESLWALTTVLVAMIRSGPQHKLDVLALVQRMISLRMAWGEHIDAKASAVN